MFQGLFKRFSHIDSKTQKHIERRQKVVELFYANPYMQAEVKEFRKKYSIPEEGFDNYSRESKKKYIKWLDSIYDQYPDRWKEPPEKLIEEQKGWEELSPEEQQEAIEPMEYWEPDCLINVKQFQVDLRHIFNRYNRKIPNDDLAAFEKYAVTNEIDYPIIDFTEGEQVVRHLPLTEQKLVSSEKDESGNVVKRVIQVELPYSAITEDQPSLIIEENEDRVTKVYIELKPNTNLRSISGIWSEVERYQKQMDGYQERKRERHNLYRDAEILRLVKFEGQHYHEVIEAWNKKHADIGEGIYTDDVAIQHAIERLDRLFNPDI